MASCFPGLALMAQPARVRVKEICTSSFSFFSGNGELGNSPQRILQLTEWLFSAWKQRVGGLDRRSWWDICEGHDRDRNVSTKMGRPMTIRI